MWVAMIGCIADQFMPEFLKDFSKKYPDLIDDIKEPSKALFDLLYFRTRQFRGVNPETIREMIDDLRIDIDEMEEAEQENFYSLIKEINERTNIGDPKK